MKAGFVADSIMKTGCVVADSIMKAGFVTGSIMKAGFVAADSIMKAGFVVADVYMRQESKSSRTGVAEFSRNEVSTRRYTKRLDQW